MSLLPAIFLRGERMRPLGTPTRRKEPAPAAPASATDWRFATKGDGAPKLVRLHLTDEAQAEEDAFTSDCKDRGCVCWTGCAPCSFCTHPGNPANLAEDDSAWVYGHEGSEPT